MPSSASSRRICVTEACGESASTGVGAPDSPPTSSKAASTTARRRAISTADAVEARGSAGAFFEQGVEETVVFTQGIVRDSTGNPGALGQQMAGRRSQSGIGVVRKKRIDLMRTFFTKNRAGAVDEAPAGPHQGPERSQKLGLLGSQLLDVAFSAQPPNVGMATHDARRGTGRVEQDGIERRAVPPRFWARGVGHDDSRLQSEARERLLDAAGACSVNFKRRDFKATSPVELKQV